MCGIVGFSGKGTQNSRRAYVRLIKQSCIRGEHAFGIAYKEGEELKVYKDIDLQKVVDRIPNPLPDKIIFHNRYSTSGDWKIIANNQPIVKGASALVFNGTIDMGTKEQMQRKYGFEFETDNDGEIVLHDIHMGKPFEHIKDDATFAGVYLTGGGYMVALRNTLRPLWRIDSKEGTFVCSTSDIALRSEFKICEVKEFEPNILHEL